MNSISESGEVRVESIPDSLRSERRWGFWRYRHRIGKKPEKKPLRPFNHTNPETWKTLDDLLQVDVEHDGVGIVLGDGLIGIDLDNCFEEDGALNDVARDALALGSYAEESPSGNGIKVFIKGAIPEGRRRFKGREIYSGGEGRARWFSVTGNRIGAAVDVRDDAQGQELLVAFYEKWFRELPKAAPGPSCSSPGLTDDEILELIRKARNRKKFEALFTGIWREYYPSPSEGDAGLIGMLRFYSEDPDQLDRLFRKSGLMRPKWDSRRGNTTYGRWTIDKVLSGGGKRYNLAAPLVKNPYPHPTPAWYGGALVDCDKTTRRLAGLLLWFADAKGHCGRLPGRALAKELGVSIRSVQRAKNRLERVGILRFEQVDDKDDAFSIALGSVPYRNYLDFGAQNTVKRLTATPKAEVKVNA